MKGIVMGISPRMMSDSTIESLVKAHGLKGYEARQYIQNIKAVRSNELQKNPLTPYQMKLIKNSYKKPIKRTGGEGTKYTEYKPHIISLSLMSDKELDIYGSALSKQVNQSKEETISKIIQLKSKGYDYMSSTELLQELRKKQAQNASMDIKQAVGEYYKQKISVNETMSFEAKQALGIDEGEGFLPKVLRERIVLDYPIDNPLREIMTVTTDENLPEVPVMKYSGNDELKIEADTVAFQPIHDRIRVNVSDTVVHGTTTNLTETIENAIISEMLSREVSNIFAMNPEANKSHMSVYHNGIETVAGNNIYDAVDNALKDLPQSIRDHSSIVMSLEDYQNVVRHLGTIGLGGLAANPDMIWNMKLVIMDQAVKPVIGDFELLHANYERISFGTGKDVTDGIYTIALPVVMDIRVLLPKAFRIAEAE